MWWGMEVLGTYIRGPRMGVVAEAGVRVTVSQKEDGGRKGREGLGMESWAGEKRRKQPEGVAPLCSQALVSMPGVRSSRMEGLRDNSGVSRGHRPQK